MLSIDEINKEIKNLEESGNTSYSTCQKLAILYIVRDHINKPIETKMSSPLTMEKSAVCENELK